MLTRHVKTPEFVSAGENCVRHPHTSNYLILYGNINIAGFAVFISNKSKINRPHRPYLLENPFSAATLLLEPFFKLNSAG
jgi:hypothetical protein